MTQRRTGNREDQFLYKHPNAGIGPISSGLVPGLPIVTHGGVISAFIDVNVPATNNGDLADFSANYPELGPSPNEFPLLRYADPIDTARKLNGKGNLLISNLLVLYGSNHCGAAPPGGSGTKAWTMVLKIGTRTVWTTSSPTTYDNDVGRVSASTPFVECFVGADHGDNELRIASFTAGQNLTAGRLRIWWQMSEV